MPLTIFYFLVPYLFYLFLYRFLTIRLAIARGHSPILVPYFRDNYHVYSICCFADNVCLRPWSFERIPNKMIRGLDNALIYTSTKEACLAACLNEHRFTCRSLEYNYVTLQCHLSDSDRRTTGQFVQFVDAQGVDYFENLCLKGK